MPSEFALARFLPEDPRSRFISKVRIGDYLAAQEWEVALAARDQRAADIVRSKRDVLEAPARLAAPDARVPLDACVQLLAASAHARGTLAFAVQMHPDDYAAPFNAGCALGCSAVTSPTQRSVFHVVPELRTVSGVRGVGPSACPPISVQDTASVVQGAGAGVGLNYGQRFMLRPAHAQHLLVRAEIPLIDAPLAKAGHPQIRLSATADRYCIWSAWPRRPRDRDASRGLPTPTQRPCIIRHEATGQCIAAETDFWSNGAQGTECEATLHSVLDIYGKETDKNFWTFNIQTPAELTTPPACCNTD